MSAPARPAGLRVREATGDDAAAIAAIYAWYVENTVITFEIDPVSDLHGSSDYRRKVAKVLVRRALGRALERVLGGA